MYTRGFEIITYAFYPLLTVTKTRVKFRFVSFFQKAPTPIGVLHEIMRDESGFKKMGNNVEALYENIDYTRHITFINGDGEPLLIFSQAEQESSILRTKQKQTDRLQLILRVNTQYYLLTFSSNVEAHRFSQALSKFLKPLHLGQLQGYYKSRFENNDITINSWVVFWVLFTSFDYLRL